MRLFEGLLHLLRWTNIFVCGHLYFLLNIYTQLCETSIQECPEGGVLYIELGLHSGNYMLCPCLSIIHHDSKLPSIRGKDAPLMLIDMYTVITDMMIALCR